MATSIEEATKSLWTGTACVATVPGSSFYSRPELGRTKVRFAFPKRAETLAAAADRLLKLAPAPA